MFHCIPLMHLGSEPTTFPLMEGMDVLFYEKEERVRIKQQSGDIARVIRRELNKDRNKLPKLLQALDEAMDCERYREYGDLLFAYRSQLQKQPTITLPSFEREEEVTIPIDMRFDLRHNANRYYQKYHKQRRAQSILKEQIVLCEEQIRYFEQLEAQLEIASVPDAMEIREELVHQGYMKARKAGIHRRAKGKQAPHFTTFEINGVRVYLGKNNLQNEYLTRTLARKSDLWFHAKGYHGAHVICTDPQPEESLLRTCAMLAAYYSKGRYSSSVPVDYCAIRQLKKVPGSKAGMVTMHKAIGRSTSIRMPRPSQHCMPIIRSANRQKSDPDDCSISPMTQTGASPAPVFFILLSASNRRSCRSHSRRCRKSIRSAERPSAVHTPAYR